MKQAFVCAVTVAFLIGCAGSKLTVKDNPFNQSKDIELKTWHKVIDGSLDNLEAKYQSELKRGMRTPSIVKFHFQIGAMYGGMAANPFTKYKDAPLDPQAQLLIDDKSYTLQLMEMKKDTTLAISDRYAGTYNDLYCSVMLTPAIERGILNAAKVMYRFSVGGEASTLLVKPDQLEKLKEYLSIR